MFLVVLAVGFAGASTLAVSSTDLKLLGPEGLRPEGDRRTRSVFVMLQNALLEAAEMEGKALDREELCASTYIPVRCGDLKNGYTGEPMRWLEGVPGEVSLVRDLTSGDLKLTMAYEDSQSRPKSYSIWISSLFAQNAALNPPWKAGGVAGPNGELSPPSAAEALRHRSRIRLKVDAQGRSLSSVPQRDKVAYFVGQNLHRELRILLLYKEEPDVVSGSDNSSGSLSTLPRNRDAIVTLKPSPLAGRAFSHPKELAQAVLSLKRWGPFGGLTEPLIFLDLYRNDFTGGFAQEGKAPEPGNYRFEVRADRSGCLVVYGANHWPVFARQLGSYQAADSGSGSGGGTQVPCPGFEDWFQ
jgi:hypothetical protein